MSDEQQPLRIKPRVPPAEGAEPGPDAPPPPAPSPAPGAEPAEGLGRLRLKAKLGLSAETPAQPPPEPALVPPPPPPTYGAAPLPETEPAAEPEAKDAPKFKLRPKAAPPPPAIAPEPPPPPPADPGRAATPAPPRSSPSMPPMSVLAAAPPPLPGSVAEAPPPPGSAPRLSLSTAADRGAGTKGLAVPPAGSKGLPFPPAGTRGLPIAGGDALPKIGGKTVVVKPVKPAAVLRKRPSLAPTAKAGLAVVVLAVAAGAFFSYRVFFPAEAPAMKIKLQAVAKPVINDLKQSAAKAGELVAKGQNAIAAQRAQQQAKIDAAANGEEEPTSVPTVSTAPTESVMGESTISKDVRVNNTPIVAAVAASPAFRAFVSNATIGGVFQGVPSRALINGTVVREGQVLDSSLGIAFERVDADKKVIYFKDYTGAEVAKNY